jgi:hypothetical protein
MAKVVAADAFAGFVDVFPDFFSATTALLRVFISYPMINPDKTQPHSANPIWLMLIIDCA